MGRVWAEKDAANSITSPSGLSFHKSQTILPKLIKQHFSLKEKYAKYKTHTLVLDHLIKIMAAAVTNDSSRFYSPALSNAIASTEEHVKDNAKTTLKHFGYDVVHQEDFRLYVSNNLPVNAKEIASLIEAVLTNLKKKLSEDGVIGKEEKNSRIPAIVPGPVYEHFFITQTGSGLRPVYLANNAHEWIRSENLLRGDVALLYPQFEKDLFSSIFRQQNPLDVIKDYVEKISNGEYNEQLLYRKRIFKDIKEYEEPYPLHVQAAKKMPGFKSKWIDYVVTTNGGEPKGHIISPINYQHYIDRLLKPLSKIALYQTAYEDALEDIFSTKPQLSLFQA